MPDIQKFWFAARTRANQELGLRNSLKKLDVEHFLPTQIVSRRVSDRVKKVEVPVIRNLIFIKSTKKTAFSLIKDYALKISYIKSRETGSLLIVPDKQMEDFMFVMDLSEDTSLQNDEHFAKGDKVRVVKGRFAGIEGEMVRIEGKTHVAIRVPGVIIASVKVPKSHLEKIK